MRKDTTTTPKSRVKAILRTLWLRSRERATALKREKYTCQRCGVKQTRIKGKEVYLNVHHINRVNWEGVVDIIITRILQRPELLEVLCEGCHDKEHEGELWKTPTKAKKLPSSLTLKKATPSRRLKL